MAFFVIKPSLSSYFSRSSTFSKSDITLTTFSGGYDPAKVDFGDLQKFSFMVTDVLLLDEQVQINGVMNILDFTLFTSAHIFDWNRDRIQKTSKCWQVLKLYKHYSVNMYKIHPLWLSQCIWIIVSHLEYVINFFYGAILSYFEW